MQLAAKSASSSVCRPLLRSCHSPSCFKAGSLAVPPMTRRVVCFSAGSDSDSSSSQPASSTPTTREFKALGMKVIESSEAFPEPQKDFWSSEAFNLFGTISSNFLVLFVIFGLIVGGIAASSFNDGATVFIQPSPEGQPKVYFQADLDRLNQK